MTTVLRKKTEIMFMPIMDIYQVAYIRLHTGEDPVLELNGRQVVFKVPYNDTTMRLLSEFRPGCEGDLYAYTVQLKKVRAMMLSVRPEK